MMPMVVPIATAIRVADRAMVREKVMPYQSRDMTSRPVPGSRPSGCWRLIPPNEPCGMPPCAMSRYFSLLLNV